MESDPATCFLRDLEEVLRELSERNVDLKFASYEDRPKLSVSNVPTGVFLGPAKHKSQEKNGLCLAF